MADIANEADADAATDAETDPGDEAKAEAGLCHACWSQRISGRGSVLLSWHCWLQEWQPLDAPDWHLSGREVRLIIRAAIQ